MSARTAQERPEQVRGSWFIKIGSGRLIGFWDAITTVKAGHSSFSTGVSRAVKLAGKWGEDPDMHGYYLERVEWLLDDMEGYIGAVRKHIGELRGTQTVRDRIALLRNVDGRTPDEAAAFHRKADELEARLGAEDG